MVVRDLQANFTRTCSIDMHRYRWSDSCARFFCSYDFLVSLTCYLQGASTGAGLGNAFLSHVRAVDGIFQVVRAFDDADVIHVEGDVNPIRDMEIIQTELRLKDIEWVEKYLDGLKRTGRALGNSSLADKAKKEEIVSDFFPLGNGTFLIYRHRRPWKRF